MVVNPEPTHGVVGSGVNPHRHRVCIFPGDPLIYVEEVAVLLANGFQAEALNSISKIQIHTLPVRPDSTTFIAHFLGISRGDIAGYEIAETWVAVLQVVVALVFGNII